MVLSRREQAAVAAADVLALDHPQIVIGAAGSLHGVHGVAVVSRHAYKPALRVRAYQEVAIDRGAPALATVIRRAVNAALKLTPSVEVVVDVTAAGAGLVQDVRQVAHVPEHVTVYGLVVGGGQAEPGGAGRWQGATASRPELIYAVQQLSAVGQVQPVDDFEDKLSLFRRRHEGQAARDESAWNDDTIDVPGVAFCAAITRWTHWRQWDCSRMEHGSRAQKLADHPACRNTAGSQYTCCCRNCPSCARKWALPPTGLQVDPRWCDYCLNQGLASPEGNIRVQTATHRSIDRRPRYRAAPDTPLLQDGIEAAAEDARRQAFGGGGRRIGPRQWAGPTDVPPSRQLPDVGTAWWTE